MLEDSWIRVRAKLKNELGLNAYKNWIDPLTFDSIESSVAKFIVPTVFMGNWVQRNFGDKICELFRTEDIKIDRLVFHTVRQDNVNKKDNSKIQGQVEVENVSITNSVKGEDIALPGSPLDTRFTFSNFP